MADPSSQQASAVLDVVVPASRDAHRVGRTLAALHRSRQHAGAPGGMFIVVDDRGDRSDGDDLDAAVEAAGAVRIATTGRAGPGTARNAGIAIGTAPWVLCCDDDVVVDTNVVARALEFARGADQGMAPAAVVGGLRPPPGAPAWLRATYADGSQFSASAALPAGPLAETHLCGALLLLRRASVEAVGGFPPVPTWEDAVLGARLGASGLPAPVVVRDHGLSGVHENVPANWAAWLERQAAAGARLAALGEEIEPSTYRRLLAGLNLTAGWRATVKRIAVRLPSRWQSNARGRHLRRLAASVAFVRGYHRAG